MRTKLNSMNAICGADSIGANATKVRSFVLIPALKRRAKLISTLRVGEMHQPNSAVKCAPRLRHLLASEHLPAVRLPGSSSDLRSFLFPATDTHRR